MSKILSEFAQNIGKMNKSFETRFLCEVSTSLYRKYSKKYILIKNEYKELNSNNELLIFQLSKRG